MKIEKRSSKTENLVLTGMIVSTQVLEKIAPRWDKMGLFDSRWSNLVASWCVKYYNKYGKAPGKAIEGLFQTWSETDKVDKDSVTLVDKFLTNLSGKYATRRKEINPEYVSDRAEEFFDDVRLNKLLVGVEHEMAAGSRDKAKKLIREYDEVKLTGDSGGIDVLRDEAILKAAFEVKQAKPLIEMKGALGTFFGRELSRDAFVFFEGPEKRGKTYWLLELAWQAMLQRRKVLLFEVGDLSKAQIMTRFVKRACRRPFEVTPKDDPVRWPIFMEPNPKHGEVAVVSFKDKFFKQPLSLKGARARLDEVVQATGTKDTLLKLFVVPNNSITIYQIQAIVRKLARQNWLTDVLSIDYADILAAPTSNTYADSRHDIDLNFKMMRSMSQEFHNLALTATQTKAESYDAYALDMSHFAGDKRKRAHATAVIGINQTEEEKAVQVYRLNYIVRREDKFGRDKFCHVAACLDVANVAVRSTF